MGVTGIIPAYNDEANIHDVIKKAGLYVDNIVVVDDGSTDSTAYIAEKMDAHVVKHNEHKGKMETLRTAFKYSQQFGNGPVIIINADDLYDPDAIPKLITPVMWSEADAVVGYNDYPGAGLNRDLQSLIDAAPYLDSDGKYLSKYLSENIGFTAFSSLSTAALTFTEDSLPEELCLVKDALNAGFKLKEVNVRKVHERNTDAFYKYKIGVVVPAYNEEKLIRTTIGGIPAYIKRIYVINDASTDRTAEVLGSINDPRLFVITHEQNQGVGAAIKHGYKRALQEDMDIVVVMGGDNQMNPAHLPGLLMPIIEGKADYTKGNRLSCDEFRCGMSSWRLLGNNMLSLVTKIGSGYWHIMDPQNGYTAISKHALSNIGIDSLYTYYGYCNDMLVKLNTFGFRTLDVTMPAHYGEEKSSIKYGRYMSKVSVMLFRKFLWRLKVKYSVMSFHPLIFFYVFGMLFLPVGVLTGLYILLSGLLTGWPVPASLPLVGALFFIAGLQMILFAMLFDMRECYKTMGTNL
ncbi:glycosyltransferase family 2 protein [Methanolobus chelungpuianus]|uniref:Glycosyl transferase family protein n=1 Tax=Methanolobus chelungpuianus TaxID=502115 RepID=A0AAE3HC56_9EURY|nr:glycosyltransferase family 2 protein [Methanolobus chelungpuianus]MCQ6963404.1 glycosyl transferase family protein [Methanolobus chelungpuianus]